MSSSESENSGSSSSSNELRPIKRKKGVRNPNNYKQNAIRNAKVHGIEHINYANKLISARRTGEMCK